MQAQALSAPQTRCSLNSDLPPANIGREAASYLFSPLKFPSEASRHVRGVLRQPATNWLLGKFVVMAVVLAISPTLLCAQIVNINNLTTVPTPGTGHDYIHGLNETVDPANGSLSVRIGVPTPAGRGISLKFAFAYDSNGIYSPSLEVENQQNYDAIAIIVWNALNNSYISSQGGWSFTWPSSSSTTLTGEIQVIPGHPLTCTAVTDYMFTDPSGGRTPLFLASGSGDDCPGLWYGTGGQGPILANLNSSTYALTVTDGDGSLYQFQGPVHAGSGPSGNTTTTVASSITDRNGNIITLSDQGNGAITATDTMGRSVVSASGFGIVGSSTTNTISVAGTPAPYQVSWETLNTGFNLPLTAVGNNTCATNDGASASGNLTVVSAITLPNGQQYTFSYDPTYGLLNKITYPSGAYVTYTWGVEQQANEAEYSYGFGPANQAGQSTYTGGCDLLLGTPVVTDRYVYVNGINTRHDHFSYSTDWNYTSDGQPWKTTTVTSTGVGGYTRVTAYSYGPYTPPQQPMENGPPTLGATTHWVDPNIPLESSALEEDGNSNVYRTVKETWITPNEMTSEQTVLNDGSTSTEIRCFNQYYQTTQIDDYGFASDGAAGSQPTCPGGSSDGSPLSPVGPLMRQSITTYPSTLQALNIVDRPQSVEEDGLNASGQWVAPAAYMLYCYDQHSLAAASPVQFTAPSTSTRGNATQAIKWVNPPGGSSPLPSCGQSTSATALVTNYYYKNDGQLSKATDPAGYSTTYTWGEALGEPSITTDGFLLQVKDAYGDHDNYTWNYANGLMASHTDPNGQQASFSYTNLLTNQPDPFNRLGEINFPDGGQTRVYYGDNPGDLYAEVQRQIVASSENTDSFTYLDGIGRATSSCSANGSGEWNCTNTSYDGFDEKSLVSYPYTSSSNSGSGSTVGDSLAYDPLGRELSLIHSDSSRQTWAYSGPTVTFQDENGNQWQRTSDGLGRLIKVVEPNGTSQTPSMPTTYGYDALGNLLTVNQTGDGSEPARTRSFSYDSLSRLLAADNPETGTQEYTYFNSSVPCAGDPSLPCTKTDARGITTNYGYDEVNRLVSKSYSNDLSGTPSSCYEYGISTNVTSGDYQIGRLINEWTEEAACPAPNTAPPAASADVTLDSNLIYDKMGRLKSEQQYTPANSSGTPYNPQYTYNLDGSVKTSTNGLSSPAVTLTMSYDDAEHLAQVASSWSDPTHPADLFYSPTYGPGGLVAAQYGYSPTTGESTATVARAYDPRLRVISESDTAPASMLSPAIESTGTITLSGSEQQTTGAGTSATGSFSVTGTEGSHEVCTTKLVYQGGVWVPVTTCNTVADTGTLSIIIDGFEATVGYGSSTTDASLASAFASALNGSGVVTASASNNVVTMTSVATGPNSNYSYTITNGADFSASTTSSALSGGASGAAIYDAGTISVTVNGNTSTVSWGNGSTSQSIASAIASAMQTQDSGFLTVSASGATIALTSTQAGAIANWAISSSATYDSAHFSSSSFSVSASGMSGGANATYGQKVAYNYSIPEPSGSNCASSGFGYDCAGNVKTVVDSVNGGWGYNYDTLNRLTAATGQSGNYSTASLPVAGVGMGWSYDSFGNVNAQNSTSANFRTSWAHYTTADNRASATMTAPGGPVYDAAGDITNDGVNLYAYDAEGRVCAVYNGYSYTGYVYDADGTRVAKGAVSGLNCNLSNNGFQTSYSYVLDAGGRDLSQVNGSGQWQFSNVYANGGLLATYSTQNNDTYFALSDWLGTKRAEVSPDGCLETFASLPFGDDLTPNGNCADAAPLHFTGKERDTESGNDYFGARYYASSTGRFLSPDWSAKAEPVPYAKLGNPQSLNLYSYVWNNPLSRNDPDGHYTCADGAKCDSANDKAFQGRLDNLKAAQGTFKEGSKEYKQIGKILSAYGGAGDTKTANGKTVSIGFSGGANTGGETRAIDKGTIGVSLASNFSEQSSGNNVGTTVLVGHEGQHVVDGAPTGTARFGSEMRAESVSQTILNGLAPTSVMPRTGLINA